ncbi:MAG: Calx-beta domain-containing protein [Thermodesulfobacteriota bacterium]
MRATTATGRNLSRLPQELRLAAHPTALAAIRGPAGVADKTLRTSAVDAAKGPLTGIVLALALVLGMAGTAQAGIYNVTKTADTLDGACDADCSLREALQAANAVAGPHTINIPAGTYLITRAGAEENANSTGDFDATKAVNFVGAGRDLTIIDGGSADRLFDERTAATAMTFTDLTLQNGTLLTATRNGGCVYSLSGSITFTRTNVTGCTATNVGGAVWTNSGSTVTVDNSTFSNNTSGTGSTMHGGAIVAGPVTVSNGSTFTNNTSGGHGGAIYAQGALNITGSTFSSNHADTSSCNAGAVYGSTTINVTDSTVSGNTAGNDGGGVMSNGGDITITRSTISGNQAGNRGGAVYRLGIVKIYNSTISGNSCGSTGAQKQGGGVYAQTGTITNSTVYSNATALTNGGGGVYSTSNCTYTNSIVANNTAAGAANNCAGLGKTSAGWNIESANTCSFGQASDMANTNPLLNALESNGGPTQTHALQAGSPAIDKADNATCASANIGNLDQRSQARPVDGDAVPGAVCDIGAFEYVSVANNAPVGGYAADNVIPAAQISQATNGSGVVTINWKGRDAESNNVTLKTFQYSVNGGSSWSAPTNGDNSAALSTNWDDNGGAGWSTATTFGAATAHSFTFNTRHADVTGLDGVDQADVQVRFLLRDGVADSASPATSESFPVDNLAPTATITSAAYDAPSDTLTITGTSFDTIAAVSTNIKDLVDWSKLVWDINGDNAVSANITFALGDVASLTITGATTLTLVFTGAKGAAIEATGGYSNIGGADTLDVTAGFARDSFGNVATTDGRADGVLTTPAVAKTVGCPGSPFTSIQSAIDDVSTGTGDTITVCDGTYAEQITFPSGKNITVVAQNGPAVTIINPSVAGGAVVFAGPATLEGFTIDNDGHSNASCRGIQVNAGTPTIRNCVVEDGYPGTTSGNRPGIYISGSDAGATLDGTTVRNNSSNQYNYHVVFEGPSTGVLSIINNSVIGGGSSAGGVNVANVGTTTTISDSTISNSTGQRGINASSSPLSISNSTISGNQGGISISGSTATITNSSISNNTVAGSGIGIYADSGAELTITGCTINSNTTTSSGYGHGAGIHLNGASTATISKTRIQGNRGYHGGGLYLQAASSATLTNCWITGNDAQNNQYAGGGGLYVTGASSTATLVNCTLAGNYAIWFGGGLVLTSGGAATLKNSILWDNNAGGGGAPNISGSPAVTYSDVEGGFAGEGNIAGGADPFFADLQLAGSGTPTAAGDFDLTANSTAVINAGTPTDAPVDDIHGDVRIGNPDLGADEYPTGGNTAPVGGYTADNLIPQTQISQATDGSGLITINWKGRDDESNNVTLKTFQYSVNGGSSWAAPTNGDSSAALSVNWDDNGGAGWSTATTFGAATAHSFTFNTRHADVTGLDGVDQSDVQVRFTLNDGTADSASPTTSESFRVDDLAPTATISSATYNAATDTLTITGTSFDTIAAVSTDIKGYVDWSKLVWDVNGDGGTSANISFVLGDVTSLTVTNATTLTLVFTSAKGTAIEATTGYGSTGGADTLDVTAGFSKDAFGNAATTDGVADGPIGSTISGTVYTDEGVSTIADGTTIRLLVNGQSAGADTTSSGAYSITTMISAGDAILVYVDDGAGTNDAATVTVSNGSALSGLNIYKNRVITRHDNSGALTNALMSTAKGAYSDTDILYSVSGGNLTTTGANTELFVWAGHTFAPGGTVSTQHMDINGTLSAATNAINVAGNWDATGGSFTSTGTVTFNAASGTITITSGGIDENHDFQNIVFNDAGGTATFQLSGAISARGDLTITDGIFTSANFGVTVDGNLTDTAAGRFVANASTISVGGDVTLNPNNSATESADFNNASLVLYGAASTLTYSNLNASWDNGFQNLTAGQNGVVDTLVGNISVRNSLTLGTGGITSASYIYVTGSGDVLFFDPASTLTLSTLLIGNRSGGSVNLPTLTTGYNARIEVGGGQSTVNQTGPVTATQFTIGCADGSNPVPSCTHNTNGFALTVNGNMWMGVAGDTGTKTLNTGASTISVKGNFEIRSAQCAFNAGTSTVILNGITDQSVTTSNKTFNHLTINNTGAAGSDDIIISGTLDVNGTLTITDGDLDISTNNPAVNTAGNVTIGASGSIDTSARTASWTFDGTSLLTDSSATGPQQLGNVVRSSTSLTLGSSAKMKSFTNNAAGAMNLGASGYTLELTGTGTPLANSGTFTAGTSTVKYTGTSTATNIATVAYSSLELAPAAATIYSLTGNLTGANALTSSLTIGADATLTTTASSYNLALAGNWNNSGAFTANNGTVTLNGTDQSLAGSTTFNNLTKTTAAGTLTFATGATTTVSGTATLQGASGQLLSLRSSAPGTKWYFTLPLGANKDDIDFVDVQDSDASGSDASLKPINPGNSTDSGNTIAWFDTAPVGGYTTDNVIPQAQVSQATDGSGLITISWKGRDNESNSVTLKTFQYSVNNGSSWSAPTNGDGSASLSATWSNNGGAGWSTATTFGAATAHSFTFNTRHADVTGLDGVDQSDVQVRFTLNDGTADSASPTTSESFRVDDLAPTATISSATYNAATDTLTITGTSFDTVAAPATDIKDLVDWSKLAWDINGDNATTADVTFLVDDVSSLTVADATTLTLVLASAKATAIEGNAGFRVAGGNDTLDVTAGFLRDAVGNAATTDAAADAALGDITPPGAASDLASGTTTASSVQLTWTAPGNDATVLTAASYDIRYATSNITNDTDFSNASPATGEPAPSVAGTGESFTVTGLSPNTLYYFAVKTTDDSTNTSTLSNIASTTTAAGGSTMILHPSGLASNPGSYATTGGDWADVLDSNDGDTTYASRCCTGPTVKFWVDMDDPTGLAGATLNSITFHAAVRNTSSDHSVNLGYMTDGASTVWYGSAVVTAGAAYTLLSSAPYTTDSTGGALDLADLNNLQIAVDRIGTGPSALRVTEIYAVIDYTPGANNATVAGAAAAVANGDTAISVSMPYTDDANADNTYTVQYKLSSSGTWLDWGTNPKAHTASPYATTITGLTPGETYDVRLTYNDADGVTGTNPQTVSNIALPIRSVSLTTAAQGVAEDAGTVTVTATLSATSGATVTVPFTVAGTATGGGTDHNLANGSITVTAGQLTGTTSFAVTNDTLDENDETVVVTMGSPTNASAASPTVHTVTITDNDATPTVSFTTASQATAGESGTATITAQLSAASGLAVTVPFTVNGASTATGGGTDYSISASPVTISPGATTATITVTVAADTLDESNETVVVDMGTPTNATASGTTSHTVTITDDDEPPAVSFASASQGVGEGAGTATVAASLTALSGKTVTVPFTVGGTATGGGIDHNLANGTITITAGQLTGSTQFTVTDDPDVEGNETVTLTMGSPTNATPGATTVHTVTITDNDGVPDTTPPAAITDLTASATGPDWVALTWTAPGDDNNDPGTATTYDVRFAKAAITAGTWAAATPVAAVPGPALRGTTEHLTVFGLESNTIYHFAVKTADEVPNLSGLSNSPSGKTSLLDRWNMVSCPLIPSPADTASVFGDDANLNWMFYWTSTWDEVQPAPEEFGYYSDVIGGTANAQATVVQPGLGLFVWASGLTSLTDAAGAANTSPSTTIALQAGYNLVGNPYDAMVALSSCSVTYGSTVSYSTAVTNGWIGNALYIWDGSTYVSASWAQAVLEPWKAYWLFSYHALDLTVYKP